jgi:hypothetical protein
MIIIPTVSMPTILKHGAVQQIVCYITLQRSLCVAYTLGHFTDEDAYWNNAQDVQRQRASGKFTQERGRLRTIRKIIPLHPF